MRENHLQTAWDVMSQTIRLACKVMHTHIEILQTTPVNPSSGLEHTEGEDRCGPYYNDCSNQVQQRIILPSQH